ncbi:MAG: sugar phosphate isomerase/epimerase family protein [Candidatus Poribacteria bacterium]
MRESMYKYMKLGIVHFMAFPTALRGEGPIAESVSKIAEDDFFSAIELTWIKDAAEKEKTKAILEASSLAVAYAAQPAVLTTPLNPNSLDDAERRKAVDTLKGEIDSAYDMNAVGIAFLSGKDPGDEQRKDAMAALIATTQELCDYAKSKGNLKVVLETFDRAIDKKALIGPSDEAAAFAETVNRANFGLMVDLSHLPIQFESAKQSLSNVKDYLVHAHVGNCIVKDSDHPGYGDMHPRFGIEGGENGVEELTEFLAVLFDVGYLGEGKQPFVSFEVKPLEDETSEIVIANAKRTMREAWIRL